MGDFVPGPRSRPPSGGPPEHPGAIVRRELLVPSGLTERAFAALVGISVRTLSELVCKKRPATLETPRKLARAFPQIDAEAWRDLQYAHDRWKRSRSEPSPTSR